MKLKKDRVVIASDVIRDGIGIEVYKNNKLVLEIFRSDKDKNRIVNLFQKDIPLSWIEESLEVFRKEIPRDFND
ncbi:MAG: hypothetical protein ABF274_04710 [Nonlabens sp.]|jgi:hypothetical protein|uniref:hypothetical protein n=1 Tax=Nonlabens sp. TaxID=1888209 RepID=UPI00321A4923